MKVLTLTLSMLGLLCVVISILTAVLVIPPFLEGVMSLSSAATTTLFWAGISGLLFLAGISFGVYSIKEF